MKLIYSILISCLLFVGQAHAASFELHDATSFDPQPVLVSAADNSVPVGTVIIWTKEIIPEGWLECNGQPVNEALYPDLHKLMPSTPNYQGMFLRGAGSQSFVQNNGWSVGNTNTVYASAGLGQIQGDATRRITGWFSLDNQSPFCGGIFYNTRMTGNDYNASGWEPVTQMNFDNARFAPTAAEIRPVNIAVKYIIKAE